MNKICKCENCNNDIIMTPYKIRDSKKRGVILCQKCKLALAMTPEKKEALLQKQKNTMIAKYGADNFSKTENFKSFMRGENNPMSLERNKQKLKQSLANRTNESIQKSNEKRKKTCLEKYGYECSLQGDGVKIKTKSTLLKLYGVENVSKSEIIKKKKEKTFLEHFGVEHGFQSEVVKSKIKSTLEDRYGVNNPGKVRAFRDKTEETCFEKYGVKCFFQSEDFFKNKISKIDYDGHTFDSSDEVEFYKNLKQQNVKFEMQVKYPKPYIVDGKEHWTFVDFYIPEDDLWIEVKGRHFFDEEWNPVFRYGAVHKIEENKKAFILWKAKLDLLLQNNIQIVVKCDDRFFVVNDAIDNGEKENED